MKLRHRPWINVAITALICIVAIVIALPKSDVTQYDADIDKPWPYPRLIAPFELPVKKSAERVEQEKDSTRKAFSPYFDLVPSVAPAQIQRFQADVRAGKLGHLSTAEVQHAVTKLQELYRAGIISSEDMDYVRQNEHSHVQIVVGTTSTLRETRLLLTKNSAREFLLSEKSNERDQALLEQLDNYLHINLTLDKKKSSTALQDALSEIATIAYVKPAGAKIIDRGDIVSEQHLMEISSFNEELHQRSDSQKNVALFFIGRLGLILSCIGAMTVYLILFRRRYLLSAHKIYLIFSLVTIFCILAFTIQNLKVASVYVVPFVMVPIVLRIFTDSRTAFLAHLTTILIVSFANLGDLFFIPIQLLAGLLAVYSLSELTQRSQIIRTAAVVTVGTALFIFFTELATLNTFNRDLEFQGLLTGLNLSRYRHLVASGVLLLFTYPLLYLIERIFGFTSAVTLIELSNINNPILRRLAKLAQGTFVHSMQVGNLAAEVADKIGADALLVRTAALYHDIGKMLNPGFFTENQGALNPHDLLSEEESARIIIEHVTEGLRLAEKYRLPKTIRDIIRTHHGRSLVRYFYIQAVNKRGAENVKEEDYRYPGPNPNTLEQAIIMMADSVEAASRSLKDHTEESISQLVNRIIDNQVADGAFNNCPITYRDITQARHTLIESLKTIYHVRITYPELKSGNALPSGKSRGLFFTNRPKD